MRLSDHAKSLANRMYEKPPLVQQFLGKSGWNLDVLKLLAECGEPAAIPYIVPILITGTGEEILAGARTIEGLLSKTAPEDLVWLDERMRDSWTFGVPYFERWREFPPGELIKWVGPGEPGRQLLHLASLHANGFVREEAVRRLGLTEDGSELPYLLLRLNDWVAQVRDAAKAAVLRRIQNNYGEHFVRNLALVVRLERARRADHTEILEGVSQLLSNPVYRPALLAGMNSDSRIVRRSCYQLLTADKPADLPGILLQALQSKDSVIRLWAARTVEGVLPAHQLTAVLPGLAEDPFVPVRREALRLWVSASPDDAEEPLLTALLDASRAVREEARFHLRRISDLQFASFYRKALETSGSKQLVAALSGLAETGGAADAELVESYLSHPVARVRATAAQCLIRLGGRQYVDRVLSLVMDVSPCVSAHARKALASYASTVGAGPLWTLFDKAAYQHTRSNLIHLIAALPKWESVSCLVLAASQKDSAVARLAASYVLRWNTRYNRSQSAPSHDQLMRLEAALSHSAAALGGATQKAIRFAVDSFK